MIDFFKPSEPYSAQTQRVAARAQYGAADMFELAIAASKITAGDVNSWNTAWNDLAVTAEAEAIAAEKAGHTTTAIERFFHASTYHQMSDVFATAEDDRKGPFIKSQEMFRRGAKLHSPEIRTIEITCGDETYDGYYCLPPGASAANPVPGVVFIGGADAYTEETYFSGKGILDRGMAMILVDYPGRGSSLYLKGIPTRFDYEVPVKAALDWFVAQPEIDGDRIGLLGISFGGYYGPRVAAFEPRFKALVAWGGMYNVIEDIFDFNPRARKMMQFLTNTKSDDEARAFLKPFDLKDVAPKIKIPVMIVQGAKDPVCAVHGAQHLYDALTVKDKTLHIYDGPGQMHCSYDYWRVVVPVMFDWLREKLG